MTVQKTFAAAAIAATLVTTGCSATTTQNAFNKASGLKQTYDTMRQVGGGELSLKRHENGLKGVFEWKI